MALEKMGKFTVDHTALPSKISGQADQMKERFNSRSGELKTVLNALIDALEAVTDGSSGADNIGMTPTTATGAAATVQAVIEALIALLKATDDGSSGADFIGATAVDGLTGATTQALIESLKAYVDADKESLATHKASDDHDERYYTADELGATAAGSSGADRVGATAVDGLTGATTQALIESLKAYVDADKESLATHKASDDHDERYFTEAELKSTTTGSSGAEKIGAPAIDGVDGTTVKDQLASIKGLITAGGISELSEDESPQLGGELDQNSHTIGGAEYNNGNSGTSKTIDWTKGNHQKVTMNGNCTFTFLPPSKACMLSLRFINDGTSGRTITLPTIKWPNGAAPTWTKLANAIDILSLYYDGSAYYGQAGLKFS